MYQTPTAQIQHGSKDKHPTASKENTPELANKYTQFELKNVKESAVWR